MSRFHEELVAARRRGDAPGQDAGGGPEPSPVSFPPLPVNVPLTVCSRCGVAVPADRVDYHAEWHQRIAD